MDVAVPVSVIVVNHERAELLRECLQSLRCQSLAPWEVLVVDNGSRDASREVVESFRDERLRWIPLSANRGFAAANNIGIEKARGELIALLNNDATAHRSWLQELVSAAGEYPAAGMFASKILIRGTRFIDKAGHLIFPDGQNRGRGSGELDLGQYDRPEEALFPDGCAALYRTRMLRELGGFDEDFFAYADDADLGLRARWRDWGCRYIPSALAYHRHSSTTGSYAPRKIYWIERNRIWLALKNFPTPLLAVGPLLTLLRVGLNLAAALARRGPAGNFRSQLSLKRLAEVQLQAYRDALGGVRLMLNKRRRIFASRKLSSLQYLQLLHRFRISARTLAFQDVPLSDRRDLIVPSVVRDFR